MSGLGDATTTKKTWPAEGGRAVGCKKKILQPIVGKEFNYVLQLTQADTQLLNRYKDVWPRVRPDSRRPAITTCSTILTSPMSCTPSSVRAAISANSCEACWRISLSLLSGDIGEKATAQQSEQMGRSHYRRGVKPVWTLGAYRLFLDHLQQLVATDPQIARQKIATPSNLHLSK